MKHFIKKFTSLILAAGIFAGAALAPAAFGTVSVCAADYIDLSAANGYSISGSAAVSGSTYEVRFISPLYNSINAVKNDGYTKLSINYTVNSYTASGTAGVMPFVAYGDNWSNGDVWKNMGPVGVTSTAELDFSSFSAEKDYLEFGIQFANVTGNISYTINSAKLIKTGSGSSSGSGAENTVTENDDVELNYAKLLQESLYFYDANMCGSEVDERSEFSWRNDCHTYDSSVTYNGKTIDLSGGYHDAGDHVKFGLPAAYSASVLGIAYLEYPQAFDDNGLTAHYKRIMDHFAEYFKKCTVLNSDGSVAAFCYQVGDGDTDHSCGDIPEVQTTYRPASFTSASDPCTDIVCETAAALALHYINFGDESSLEYAEKLFDYADGMSNKNFSTAQSYYAASSYTDDYALAAAMLYKATKSEKYKTKYNSAGDLNCGWAASWDDVKSLANLYSPSGSPFNSTVSSYVLSQAGSTNSEGFVVLLPWGSARYNTALQMMGLLYDKKSGTDLFSKWAAGQMSYILGSNDGKKCFVVGFNNMSIVYPHHRAAYGYGNFPNGSLRPKHLIIGALAGGPKTTSTAYDDNLENYTENEVALDYNAGLVCAAAALYSNAVSNGSAEEKALQKPIVLDSDTYELRMLYQKGDADKDGSITDKDTAVMLKQITSGTADKALIDTNGDNVADIRDVIYLLNNM